jgi:hypothetical protein
MFKQIKRVAQTLLVTGTIVALSATGVMAAAPTGAGPDTAVAPSADWLPLAENGADWYAFTYDGEGEQVEVVADVYPESSVDISIWTPDQIRRGGSDEGIDPIGYATANDAVAGDLNWAGNFNLAGTYYVVVEHNGSRAETAYYQLTVSGIGVGFPQADTVQGDDNVAADMTDSEAADNDANVEDKTETMGSSSDDALAIDGQWMPLEVGHEYWFAFSYVGDNEQIEVWLDVEPNEGASFSVWTPEQLRRLGQGEDIDPVGRGNSSDNTPGDLFWAGSFDEGGTYHVRVDHSGNNTSYAALNIK